MSGLWAAQLTSQNELRAIRSPSHERPFQLDPKSCPNKVKPGTQKQNNTNDIAALLARACVTAGLRLNWELRDCGICGTAAFICAGLWNIGKGLANCCRTAGLRDCGDVKSQSQNYVYGPPWEARLATPFYHIKLHKTSHGNYVKCVSGAPETAKYAPRGCKI